GGCKRAGPRGRGGGGERRAFAGCAGRHGARDSAGGRPHIREVRRSDRGGRSEEPRGGGHDSALQAAAVTWLAPSLAFDEFLRSMPPLARASVIAQGRSHKLT